MNARTLTPHPPITEPSAWMRGTGAAQVRRIRALGLDPDTLGGPLILAPLVGRLTEHSSEDDRRCDRCGRYCDPSEPYVVLTYGAAARVLLVGGLCELHAQAEGVRRG